MLCDGLYSVRTITNDYRCFQQVGGQFTRLLQSCKDNRAVYVANNLLAQVYLQAHISGKLCSTASKHLVLVR